MADAQENLHEGQVGVQLFPKPVPGPEWSDIGAGSPQLSTSPLTQPPGLHPPSLPRCPQRRNTGYGSPFLGQVSRTQCLGCELLAPNSQGAQIDFIASLEVPAG